MTTTSWRDSPDERGRAALSRDVAATAGNHYSAKRDTNATVRNQTEGLRDQAVRERLEAAEQREEATRIRQAAARARAISHGLRSHDVQGLSRLWDQVAVAQQGAEIERRAAAADREAARDLLAQVFQDRLAAAADREAAARDRKAAAADREAAFAARQQAAVERAQETAP